MQKRTFGHKGNEVTQTLQRIKDFNYLYSAPGFETVPAKGTE
jgi:hypothetical protein